VLTKDKGHEYYLVLENINLIFYYVRHNCGLKRSMINDSYIHSSTSGYNREHRNLKTAYC